MMKRMNLVIHEDVLEEARCLAGDKTYSRTVDRALAEFVLRHATHPKPAAHAPGILRRNLARVRHGLHLDRGDGKAH